MLPPSYSLITSTRFDPFLSNCKWNNDQSQPCPFLLLRSHFGRLVSASIDHGWHSLESSYHDFKAACLEAVDQTIPTDDRPIHSFKVRISLSYEGALTFNVTTITPCLTDPTTACYWRPLQDNPQLFGPPTPIILDLLPSETSLFTRTKTSNRQVYDTSRERSNLPNVKWDDSAASQLPKDVILYTVDGTVTETTFCNICVYRSPSWFTPPLSTGCLPGIMRQWMLDQGRIREADPSAPITKESIQQGDYLLLLNSVRGCVPAKVITIVT